MVAAVLTAVVVCLPTMTEADQEMLKLETAIVKYFAATSNLKEARQQFREAGGISAKALPIYLKMLRSDPRPTLGKEQWILSIVGGIEGDRSAFRPFALALLEDKREGVVREAVRVLGKFGAEEDAPKVAALFPTWAEERNFHYQIVGTLRVIGTEKEIAVLEKARKDGLYSDRLEFWKEVDECEQAIRERAAKKKEQDLKAKSADKKDK